MTAWAKEQVEMRLGYSRRLARRLRTVRPAIKKMGVTWAPWMQQVMLYYYYPEKLASAKPWVRQLAEILVACEQFEAYSNQRRGRDYYVRKKETLVDAFAGQSADEAVPEHVPTWRGGGDVAPVDGARRI